jgi:hypothetical protein
VCTTCHFVCVDPSGSVCCIVISKDVCCAIKRKSVCAYEKVNLVKLLRANGECLGSRRR